MIRPAFIPFVTQNLSCISSTTCAVTGASFAFSSSAQFLATIAPKFSKQTSLKSSLSFPHRPSFTTLNSTLPNPPSCSVFSSTFGSHHGSIRGSSSSGFAGLTRSCTSQRMGLKPYVFQSVTAAVPPGSSVRWICLAPGTGSGKKKMLKLVMLASKESSAYPCLSTQTL